MRRDDRLGFGEDGGIGRRPAAVCLTEWMTCGGSGIEKRGEPEQATHNEEEDSEKRIPLT